MTQSDKILAFLNFYGLEMQDLAEMKASCEKDDMVPAGFVFPSHVAEIFGIPIYFDDVEAVRLECIPKEPDRG